MILNWRYLARNMIGTIIRTIGRKENYDIPTYKRSIKWAQLKSQRDGGGCSLTQTK
jgi:hypothetical protein